MNRIKTVKTSRMAAGVVLALGFAPVWAQQAPATAPVDHSQMDHSKMGHGAPAPSGAGAGMPEASQMDHSKMGHGTPPETSQQGAGAPAPMPMMDHGNMQGGTAPPDARDPNAYAGGYTRGTPELRLQMADEHMNYSFLADRLEAVRSRGEWSAEYEIEARIGRDYDRAVLKAEGEIEDGRLHEARTELLWSHAYHPYWDAQFGVRYDSGEGPNRSWLAFGVQGLSPYWFEVDATAYVGESGRTALRLSAEYELLLTQRLILQPRLEANAYGKADPERGLGSGLSDLKAGVRLRYEIRREFAPYVGVERAFKLGNTGDLAKAEGEATRVTRWVAGLRFWF